MCPRTSLAKINICFLYRFDFSFLFVLLVCSSFSIPPPSNAAAFQNRILRVHFCAPVVFHPRFLFDKSLSDIFFLLLSDFPRVFSFCCCWMLLADVAFRLLFPGYLYLSVPVSMPPDGVPMKFYNKHPPRPSRAHHRWPPQVLVPPRYLLNNGCWTTRDCCPPIEHRIAYSQTSLFSTTMWIENVLATYFYSSLFSTTMWIENVLAHSRKSACLSHSLRL